MNILKTDFIPKQKRLQQKPSKPIFSSYRSVTLERNSNYLNILTTDENRNRTSSSSSVFINSQNEKSGREITNTTLNTSEEFQKLMMTLKNVKSSVDPGNTRENYSESESPSNISEKGCSVQKPREEESNEPLPKKAKNITLTQYKDYEVTSNEIPSRECGSSFCNTENLSRPYSIFDYTLPKNQKSTEEIIRKNVTANDVSPWPTNGMLTVFRTPNQNKLRDFSSSSFEIRTPKIGKSPKTSGSSKIVNSDSRPFILAVTEGRGHARGEVGIAGMDPKRPHLILSQISDTQRYVHSLTKMNIFSFTEVIVPNTFVDGATSNKLYCDIRSRFPTVTLTSVQRKHFNEAVGLDLIKQYCSPESTSIMMLLRDKFYALSASAALLKYIEFTQNVHLAPRSLKVEYQGTEDTMIIDLDTANRLELVMCANHPEINFNNSLLGVVNHCHTKGGVRLLRANILQPPCALIKIQKRLDCVTELVNNPLLLCSLEGAVGSFTNLENLLNLCMHAPQQDGIRIAEHQLKYTLLLKTVLELLPVLISSLNDAKSEYFQEVQETLRDPRFTKILNRILETVFENAKSVKGSVAAHLHGCFAIKTGVNSLLDIAKKTYCEIVQEISDHVTKLRETYNLSLRVSYSANKGFHIQYTLPPGQRATKKNELPKEFILVQKSKTTFSFYTAELVALDQRSQNVLNEIKLMTNVILFELLTDIRHHIGCLYNLCEHMAELDVLVSFAHVSSGANYTRPKFGDELKVTCSRHPILDVILDREVVPNDMCAKINKNFMILTGPNQSGKSIYIRQVALLQIMAQIGCYVPAKEATFRITDRIFSRIGFDDSIESNACTLIVEMRDIEFIKQNLTSNSLVIIDELCRGTSIDEGTSLAFAICELFLDSPAFTFFTTHYMFLTKLEEMYFNVANFHFDTIIEFKEEKPFVFFKHLKKQGATDAESYGLMIAKLTSFPKAVSKKAQEIAEHLRKERKPNPSIDGLLSKYELSKRLRQELLRYEPPSDWKKIKPIVQNFKKMFLNLMKSGQKDGENADLEKFPHEKSDTKLETTILKRELHIEKRKIFTEKGRRSNCSKKNQTVLKLAIGIKRKYAKINLRKRDERRVKHSSQWRPR